MISLHVGCCNRAVYGVHTEKASRVGEIWRVSESRAAFMFAFSSAGDRACHTWTIRSRVSAHRPDSRGWRRPTLVVQVIGHRI